MFIYKTTHIDGRYYIGRCSRKYPDTYLGSGTWVRSIKDKSTLSREILSTYSTFEELCLAEEKAIAIHIDDPMCMNWNNKSVGFASGELNPSHKGMSGRKQSEKSKKKISESRKRQIDNGEWIHPMLGKKASKLAKIRSSETNSCLYEISHADGTKEFVVGLLNWCKERSYSDIVFHRRHREGKPYRGMTYVKLPK